LKEAPLKEKVPHPVFLPPSEFFRILIFTKSLPYLLYTFNIDDYYMFKGSGNTGPGAEGTGKPLLGDKERDDLTEGE